MKKDINPINNNGQHHGYQEWYYVNYEIMLRGNYKNNIEIGYEEWHFHGTTNYYIK